MIAYRELTRCERDLLVEIAALDEPTRKDLAATLDRTGRSIHTHGLTLREHGLAETRRGDAAGAGRPPDVYHLTDRGRRVLEQHVDELLDAIEHPAAAWDLVIEREGRSHDRVVEDAFCPGCGSVTPLEGRCADCRELEDGVIA